MAGVLPGLAASPLPDVTIGDAGQNAQVGTGARREIPFSVPSGIVGPFDCSGFRWCSLQLTAVGNCAPQVSNDGQTWVAVGMVTVNAGVASTTSGNLGSTGVYGAPISARYLRFNISSGTATGVVELLSTPAPPLIAPSAFANATFQSASSDAAPSNSSLMVVSYDEAYNGASWDRLRTPSTFKTATATASGDTALWAPTSGKKFRLMRYMIQVTGDAATSGGADIDIILRDATTALGGSGMSLFVPAAGGATLGMLTTGWVDLGNGQLSAAANNVLNVNLSAALSAGKARVVCCGTEE